jgi:hypothetical protein
MGTCCISRFDRPAVALFTFPFARSTDALAAVTTRRMCAGLLCAKSPLHQMRPVAGAATDANTVGPGRTGVAMGHLVRYRHARALSLIHRQTGRSEVAPRVSGGCFSLHRSAAPRRKLSEIFLRFTATRNLVNSNRAVVGYKYCSAPTHFRRTCGGTSHRYRVIKFAIRPHGLRHGCRSMRPRKSTNSWPSPPGHSLPAASHASPVKRSGRAGAVAIR